MLIEINRGHVCSFLSESYSDRATNSAIAARYERDLVFELTRGVLVDLLGPRSRPHLRFETRPAVLMLPGTRTSFFFAWHLPPFR